MKIYTTISLSEKKLEMVKKHDLGIMIPTPQDYSVKSLKLLKENNTKTSLDNGAFNAINSGYPFPEYDFLKNISLCRKAKIELEFIVCPDLLYSGLESLGFSMMWEKRIRNNNLALVIQDSMNFKDITSDILNLFKYIFIGGSVKWKWDTAKEWVNFAHDNGKLCHIGQVGTVEKLRYSYRIGADSVDSSSFLRNDSWHILEEFYAPQNRNLFE